MAAMMSDEDFEIVGGEPPQEPVDVPREGIEKLAAFADDVFSPGDTIPISEITLLLPFIKFGPDESGGRTSTISVSSSASSSSAPFSTSRKRWR